MFAYSKVMLRFKSSVDGSLKDAKGGIKMTNNIHRKLIVLVAVILALGLSLATRAETSKWSPSKLSRNLDKKIEVWVSEWKSRLEDRDGITCYPVSFSAMPVDPFPNASTYGDGTLVAGYPVIACDESEDQEPLPEDDSSRIEVHPGNTLPFSGPGISVKKSSAIEKVIVPSIPEEPLTSPSYDKSGGSEGETTSIKPSAEVRGKDDEVEESRHSVNKEPLTPGAEEKDGK